MTRRDALVVALAGLWCGLAQVALGFALLFGAGASAPLFFVFVGFWLVGAAGGVTCGARLRGGDAGLLGLALALAAGARWALAAAPFSPGATVAGLVAGAAAGAFAGAYTRARAEELGDVRRVLLHGNNGFVAGYALAGLLLLVSAPALHALTAALGVGLFLARAAALARRRDTVAR